MTRCSYCGYRIKDTPFRCRYCGKYHCSKHRLPEDHKCKELDEYKSHNQERWANTIKSGFEYKFYKPSRRKRSSHHSKHKHPYNYKPRKRRPFLVFIKNYWFLILIVLLLFIILAYSKGYHSILFDTCDDGTLYNRCAWEKPYFCSNGEIVKNSTYCGCPYGYESKENDCAKIPTCSDGSFYSECGATKPFYCYEGTLVEKASICGCSGDNVKDGERCISKYETNPKTIKLTYFDYEVYKGLNEYLANLPRSITYTYVEPTNKDFILRELNNEIQKPFLLPLVEKLSAKTDDKNAQARMAIMMVQNIPYDWDGFYAINPDGRYPYEVLYDIKGVCGEKAGLMAFLLRELGFSIAIFEFEEESHRAVGIKCENGNYGSNYCFIEPTDSYPIGSIPGNYVGGADIKNSIPEIIIISDGETYHK